MKNIMITSNVKMCHETRENYRGLHTALKCQNMLRILNCAAVGEKSKINMDDVIMAIHLK